MDDLDLEFVGDLLEGIFDILLYSSWTSSKRSRGRTRPKKKTVRQQNIPKNQEHTSRSLKEVFNSNQNSNYEKKEIVMNVMKIDRKQDYITALIGTSVALSYADDGRLDHHEKLMIKELLKRHKYDLSKKTKQNIRYVKRSKMNHDKLLKLYDRLHLEEHAISKIISDLQSLLVYVKKDITKQKAFLEKLRSHYKPVETNTVNY